MKKEGRWGLLFIGMNAPLMRHIETGYYTVVPLPHKLVANIEA